MKQWKKLSTICTLAFAFLLFLTAGTKAQAADISQTNQTSSTVTVKIDVNSTETADAIAISSDYNKVTTASKITLPANATSYQFKNLKAGCSYYVCLYYTYTSPYTGMKSSYTTRQTIVTLPEKVKNVKQKKWWYYIESVDFVWDAQTACKYDYIVYKANGKKLVSKSDVYGASSSFSVKNNEMYTVKVRAHMTLNGKNYVSAWSDKAYLFTQPMISTARVYKSGKKVKLSVKWGKVSGMNSYDIFISDKETKGYKKAGTVKASKGSATITKFGKKKLKASKKYYVYIVGKKKVGKKTYTSGRHYASLIQGSTASTVWAFDK